MANHLAPRNADTIETDRSAARLPDESEFSNDGPSGVGLDPLALEIVNRPLADEVVIEEQKRRAEEHEQHRGDDMLAEAAARQASAFASFDTRMQHAVKAGRVDTEKVWNPNMLLPDVAFSYIEQSTHGPRLVEWMADHQDTAKEFIGMNEGEVHKRLANVEQSLGAAPWTPGQKAIHMPDQMPTVGGGGGSSGRRDPSKMSMDEYVAARRSGKLK